MACMLKVPASTTLPTSLSQTAIPQTDIHKPYFSASVVLTPSYSLIITFHGVISTACVKKCPPSRVGQLLLGQMAPHHFCKLWMAPYDPWLVGCAMAAHDPVGHQGNRWTQILQTKRRRSLRVWVLFEIPCLKYGITSDPVYPSSANRSNQV